MRHPRREKGPSDSVRLFAQMFDFLSTQRTEKLLATKLDIGMVSGRRMFKHVESGDCLRLAAAARCPCHGVPDTAPRHSRSIAPPTGPALQCHRRQLFAPARAVRRPGEQRPGRM